MTKRLSSFLALVIQFGVSASFVADAAVTFDFDSGQGRVERADVQDAFDLNNGQMQKRASQISFSAVETHKIAVLCDSGDTREAVMEQSASVDWVLAPEKGSFDFFDLRGLRNILIADPEPVESICGGPGHLGLTTQVIRKLSVHLGGTSKVLLEDR